MYAAIRQYEMGAGSVRDLMPIIDSELAEVMSGLAGFVAYHVIASGHDEIVAVTLFREERDAVDSNEVASDFVGKRLQRFQLNLTSAMSGEVGVSRTSTGRVRRAPALRLAIRGTPGETSHTPTSRSATMRSER